MTTTCELQISTFQNKEGERGEIDERKHSWPKDKGGAERRQKRQRKYSLDSYALCTLSPELSSTFSEVPVGCCEAIADGNSSRSGRNAGQIIMSKHDQVGITKVQLSTAG